jgi:hypothetical protein
MFQELFPFKVSRRFHFMQKYENNIQINFAVLSIPPATQGTILFVIREITHIKKA